MSTTQFCCFPPALVARVDDASDRPVPVSPVPITSSNWGSLNGSGADVEGMSGHSIEEQLKELREMLGPLVRSIQTLAHSVVLLASRINNVEQIINTFQPVWLHSQRPHCTYVQGRNSCYLSLKCLRIPSGSWLTLGQNDGSTAAGSRRKKAGIQGVDSIKTQAQ